MWRKRALSQGLFENMWLMLADGESCPWMHSLPKLQLCAFVYIFFLKTQTLISLLFNNIEPSHKPVLCVSATLHHTWCTITLRYKAFLYLALNAMCRHTLCDCQVRAGPVSCKGFFKFFILHSHFFIGWHGMTSCIRYRHYWPLTATGDIHVHEIGSKQ